MKKTRSNIVIIALVWVIAIAILSFLFLYQFNTSQNVIVNQEIPIKNGITIKVIPTGNCQFRFELLKGNESWITPIVFGNGDAVNVNMPNASVVK